MYVPSILECHVLNSLLFILEPLFGGEGGKWGLSSKCPHQNLPQRLLQDVEVRQPNNVSPPIETLYKGR